MSGLYCKVVIEYFSCGTLIVSYPPIPWVDVHECPEMPDEVG